MDKLDKIIQEGINHIIKESQNNIYNDICQLCDKTIRIAKSPQSQHKDDYLRQYISQINNSWGNNTLVNNYCNKSLNEIPNKNYTEIVKNIECIKKLTIQYSDYNSDKTYSDKTSRFGGFMNGIGNKLDNGINRLSNRWLGVNIIRH